MKIFIVEDDELLLLMLDRMIHKMGYEVVGTATTGSEAIKAIEDINPDLVLMDIILRDNIDGIQVTEKIKKKKDFPVIYITGNSDLAIRERAQRFGYHDFLIKPTTYEVLNASIETIQTR